MRCLRYLGDPFINSLDCLYDYPVVKLMFRKHNALNATYCHIRYDQTVRLVFKPKLGVLQ